MARPKRNTLVRIRYDRVSLLTTLEQQYPSESPDSLAAALDAYEAKRRRGKDRPCQHQVAHGPGHQSTSFCEVTGTTIITTRTGTPAAPSGRPRTNVLLAARTHNRSTSLSIGDRHDSRG